MRMRPFPIVVAAAALLLPILADPAPPTAAAREAVIVTADGDRVEGDLRRLENDELVLEADGREVRVPLARVMAVDFGDAAAGDRPEDDALVFALWNGDVITGVLTAGGDTDVTVRTAGMGDVTIPLQEISEVLRPGGPAPADRTGEEPGTDPDRIALADGDSMTGVIVSLGPDGLRVHNPAFGDEPVHNRLDEIRRIRFSMLTEPVHGSDGPSVSLRLADGGQVSGRLLNLAPARAVVRHTFGAELVVDLERVTGITVTGGAFTYVSDIADLEESIEKPGAAITTERPFRRDRSVTGDVMRLDGRTYRKGLGVWAGSRVTVPVPDGARRFLVQVGVDDAAESADVRGRGVFRILVDGEERWTSSHTRSLPDGSTETDDVLWVGEEPLAADLDVTGAETITLHFDFADRTNEVTRTMTWAMAHGDWVRARFLR